MSFEEAKNIVLSKYKTIYSCVEFKDIFVFNISGLNKMDSCVFIDKNTKKIDVFQPFNFSKEYLKNGKVIEI